MNPCPCCDLAVTPEEIAALRRPSFQARAHSWMLQCFGSTIAADRLERCDRFIEEALELVQSGAYTADRAHALVDYVFGRPIGEPGQEAGGVRVTLAAFCNAFGIDEDGEAERELARILAPEIIAKIRAKQAAKPHGSARPVPVTAPVYASADPVAVKALVWENPSEHQTHALSVIGTYLLVKDFDGWRWMLTVGRQLAEVCKSPFPTISGARIAAQADYEVRIRSALGSPPASSKPLRLAYRNHCGEVAERTIIPKSIRFGATEWHPEPQWLLLAFDLDKRADREFTMQDFCPPTRSYAEGWRAYHEQAEGEITRLRELLRSQHEVIDIGREDVVYDICIDAIRALGAKEC
jgi:hypothetical protein